MVNAAHPRFTVWADAGGVPARLEDGMQAFILRVVETVEFTSDGHAVSVNKLMEFEN
jgi:hypothetical protein